MSRSDISQDLISLAQKMKIFCSYLLFSPFYIRVLLAHSNSFKFNATCLCMIVNVCKYVTVAPLTIEISGYIYSITCATISIFLKFVAMSKHDTKRIDRDLFLHLRTRCRQMEISARHCAAF